ncbi:MAG: DUF1573 domain-containing protein [Pirellulales bacterium]|nr:DUF1573 domain-containing protein [Pirellulales bacterium]
MIRSLLLVVTLVVSFAAQNAGAQEWATKMFDRVDYDFGSLARGAKSEHTFKIKNHFEEDIRIQSVQSSCGCTIPQISKEVLASGEEAELVTEFDTVKFKGPHSATITVTFAPPFSAEVRLQVRGYVRQDVVFEPGRIEFGQVPASDGASQAVAITYAGQDGWKIEDVRSASDNYEVELRELERAGSRVEYEMLVRLKKTAPTGYLSDQLTLVTSDSERRYIPLMVEGRIVPSVDVEPKSLHLGVVRPGESVTKQLVVRGTTPFRILDVACEKPDDCFQFAANDKERKLHLIPVTFTASDTPGKIVETIQITTGSQAAADSGDKKALEVVAHVEVLED